MDGSKRWCRRDWIAVLAIAAICLMIWFPVLFMRNRSFGVELDFLRQFYPARYFAVKCMASGTFPLWNPHIFCGHPFFASYQTAMIYPPNLIMLSVYALFKADFSLKGLCTFVVFHSFLAGLFMYLLAKDFEVRRGSAFLAAITFMLCGYMVSHSGHVNQHSAAAWMPLVFLFFKRSLDGGKRAMAIGSGACLGVALLAGHFQPLFYLCIMLFLYSLFDAVLAWRAGGGFKPFLRNLFFLGVVLGTAVLLASIQLVPTYELIRLSTRQKIPFEIGAAYSLPRRQIVTLLFPHFFGSSPANYTGGYAPAMWELYGYSGIIALALAVVALLRKDRRIVLFFWFLCALSVVLALGPDGYLFTVLFKSGLLFNKFHDPARILVVFGFSMAILAALGSDHLLECCLEGRSNPGSMRVFLVLGCFCAFILLLAFALGVLLSIRGPAKAANTANALRSMVMPCFLACSLFLLALFLRRGAGRPRQFAFVLVALALLDLGFQNPGWTMIKIDPSDPYKDRPASEYLARKGGVFRVEVDANTMYPSLDNGTLYGIEKSSGDDSLVLSRYHAYREAVLPSVSPGVQPGLFYEGAIRSHLLDLMNDVYFVTRRKINPLLASERLVLEKELGGVYVYRNLKAFPRAYIADAEFVRNAKIALERTVCSDRSVLRKRAFVEIGFLSGVKEGDILKSTTHRVRFIAREPQRVEIGVDRKAKGVLVLADAYYPGWQVFVDGEKKDVLKVNYLFRGVLLEGNQKRVEFRFNPDSFYFGLALSTLTLALLLACFAISFAHYWTKRRDLFD